MRNHELAFSKDDLASLTFWMVRQRWYGEKSRQLETVEIEVVSEFELEDDRYSLLIARCVFIEGADSSYLIPIHASSLAGPYLFNGDVADALHSEQFLRWLMVGFGDARRLRTGIGTELAWIAHSAIPQIVGECRLLNAEQSNTSVKFGQQAIGKFFRKLLHGTNPDPEIVGHLTRMGTFTHVPTLLGTIEARRPDLETPITIAVVQSFVPNQGDSWTWLLAALAIVSAGPGGDLIDDIRLLGQRTAELHIALATPGEDTNFAPIELTGVDTRRMQATLATEVADTIGMIRKAGIRSNDAISSLEAGLAAHTGDMSLLTGYPGTRVHGDYHLGQVLKTADDFVIIDFEGEPSRPMNERRAKASPLKDVAGMIRSFDYAVATIATQPGLELSPDELATWGRALRQAFLDGYQDALGRSLFLIVPPLEDGFEIALDAFIIEKALYEVRYELDNRPEWVEIPLRAVEATLS